MLNRIQVRDQNQVVLLAGRFFLSLIFLCSGASKIFGWGPTLASIIDHGVPLPTLALIVSSSVEIGCGLLLLAGYQAQISASILALYLIPVTLTYHRFWNFAGADQQLQMINFLKNIAITGGLLDIVARGAGLFSVDYRLSRRTFVSIERTKDHIRAVS